MPITTKDIQTFRNLPLTDLRQIQTPTNFPPKNEELPLDDFTFFDAWMTSGNLNRASFDLWNKGYKNSRGNPISPTAIETRSSRYIAWNPEQARKRIEDRNGSTYSDAEWQAIWIKYSCKGLKYSRHQFVRWVNHFNLNTPEYVSVLKAFYDAQERRKKYVANPFADQTEEEMLESINAERQRPSIK